MFLKDNKITNNDRIVSERKPSKSMSGSNF